jgi:hypothetical protein
MSDTIVIPQSIFDDVVEDLRKSLFEEWISAETVEERESVHVRMLAVQGVVEDMKIKLMRINK